MFCCVQSAVEGSSPLAPGTLATALEFTHTIANWPVLAQSSASYALINVNAQYSLFNFYDNWVLSRCTFVFFELLSFIMWSVNHQATEQRQLATLEWVSFPKTRRPRHFTRVVGCKVCSTHSMTVVVFNIFRYDPVSSIRLCLGIKLIWHVPNVQSCSKSQK